MLRKLRIFEESRSNINLKRVGASATSTGQKRSNIAAEAAIGL